MRKYLNSVFLPLLTMLLWGSLFPFIKIGYAAFSIDTSSVSDILMFAALRFLLCGVIVCTYSFSKRKSTAVPQGKTVVNIVVMGLFAIVLHYTFTYIGLSLTESSKTAILKQLGALLYVCFAFLFMKSEKFSAYKIIGAVVGFFGIAAINTGGDSKGISMGDILIILASVCTVVSNVMSKCFAERVSPLWVTGISQLSGGIILFAAALAMGGSFPELSAKGIAVFLYICTASITGYTVWYYVQRTVSLSNLFIIKFTEPLFACVFSAVLLGENILRIQYLAAFILISVGNMLAHRK